MSDELENVLGTFNERFNYESIESLYGIKSTTQLKDSTPLLELAKLAKLIKAHSTKVGILSNETRLRNNEATLTKQILELEQTVFYLLSLLPLFHNSGHYTSYLLKHLDEAILNVLQCIRNMYEEIRQKTESLVSVGRLWSLTDELLMIADEGNLGLLKKHISSSITLVNDTVLELHDWLEEPTLDNSDPFGLGSESDGEDEPEVEGSNTAVPEEMIKFVKGLEGKFKMVKLLLSSFGKSISLKNPHTKSNAETLDKLYLVQIEVIEQIDEFASSVFMLGSDFNAKDDEIVAEVNRLDATMSRLCKLLKKLNKTDAKRNQWIESWETQWRKK
ncbi:HHR116Cp [Eremothecium sinecaudum]|uniref:HHR116Cp n=1 Tax=Eremothecium sinecaudum TaxID=45286 RepID=A0A0X8HWS1_9SACH|nr:HHR116Cp [Eremothecium sinecaudum]AMD22885.1 HHR116Cp [Eremothecium sinecaudum]